jgi:hypothetical protein
MSGPARSPRERLSGKVQSWHRDRLAVVYLNTLMVRDVLADDEWATTLTDADRRGLTPLFWTHVAPYGEVKLDMSSRLALGGAG